MSKEKKERKSGIFEMLKVTLVLTLITLIAAVALAVTHTYTEPFIEKVQKERLDEGLRKVAPSADSFNEISDGVYEASENGKIIGEIRKITIEGYNGEIKALIGINTEDKSLLGIHILEHTETPGLGARSTEIKPGETEAWFQKQFRGLFANAIQLKKDGGEIDAITAATVTSRAITDAVREEMTR